jgi:hypothetical protein
VCELTAKMSNQRRLWSVKIGNVASKSRLFFTRRFVALYI